ncbi:GNAT family N-acetyltransferase [Paenibacillus montanisoli]|uniref:GNAT family N-acetyltransferase n=1 Tax=Paenibacillus montanisoli TaxID=2081970 RepID=A0A328TZI2_9BACL|nr:GNAT family N-acetyltransferase [Paenibacillus montanisoli]RAP75957.1 GNAT family N-acetyltransferase [Paenibacillus montanisoli]
MQNDYTVVKRTPTLAEYKELCTAVGWRDFMNFEAAEHSLAKSIFGVVVQYDGETVGMGRIVGDGSIYFYIQDIAVRPEHQGKGIGSLIMDTIRAYIEDHAPDKAFIGLFASQGKEAFYNKYVFQKHDGMTGMFGVVHAGKIQ